MATRSLVGTYTPTGTWRARYVHWDGSPASMIPTLRSIIGTAGANRAVRVLVEDHPYGWSSLDPATKEARPGHSGEHTVVPGFGYAYTEANGMGDAAYTADDDPSDAEYAYIIMRNPDGFTSIDVYEFGGRYPEVGGWVHLDTVIL